MEHLEGLPEHVVPVRFGQARDGEFLFQGRVLGPAAKGWTAHGLIVRPEDGYEFVYDIANDEHVPVKTLTEPRTVKAVFAFTNERQELAIRAALAKMPGFQLIEEVPAPSRPIIELPAGAEKKETRTVVVRVCAECGTPVDGALCTFDCPNDGLLPRPEGSILVRKLLQTDELVEESVETDS